MTSQRIEEIVAQSPEMRSVLERARRLAATEITALIVGEPGTGKVRLARFIHASSPRARRPLHVVHGDHVLPSELADAMSSGGTVVLAAIDALPRLAQAFVLGVLKEKKLGSVMTDVRVVATTTRDLDELAARGGFDAELAMRIAPVRLDVSPLRERRGDIVPLARQIVCRSGNRTTPELESILAASTWPGNVRELEAAIEAAIRAAGEGALLRPEHLPAALRVSAATPRPAARPPISPALGAQLDALRAEGVLSGLTDDVLANLLADGAGSSIAPLLLAYSARNEAGAAADRFLVHDSRFGQETDDIIAELSALLGSPPLFVQVANEPGVITVRGPNGEEEIYLDAGLDDVVFHFNQTLGALGDRRIVQLHTGDSRLAYFALSLPAIARLRAAGIPLMAP